jgi:hypothetical protein
MVELVRRSMIAQVIGAERVLKRRWKETKKEPEGNSRR